MGYCLKGSGRPPSIAKYFIQSFRAAIDPERESAPEHLLMIYYPEELPAVTDIHRL
ncbi:hypothetical protein C4J94_2096 [Pseudomonas sp. R5-89-07]|nr:hypothetical protein C4J94_2096 [Pseudomonas sp. R5-89-07]